MIYIQVSIIIIMALLLSSVFTALEIPILQRLKTGQNIREEGPESHLKKAGTPTMGGIAIIAGTLFACITSREFTIEMLIILSAFILFGLLGFVDDYLKVVKKQNLGLRAWQKLTGQLALAVGVAIYKVYFTVGGSHIFIPFVNEKINIGIWAVPFIIFVIVAMTNGVNLTDGLDGLASSVTVIVALFFTIIGVELGVRGAEVFFAALTGATIGFLIFNKYPAKIFMGDTGSLALGGGIAVAAIVMELELLLPIIGIIYVAETLSVMIQVGSFKIRGKRVFKMAPLHHHFELSGLKETKVVYLFTLVTLIMAFIGFGILMV